MTKKITLSALHLHIVFGDINDETTWTELTMQTVNCDQLATEKLFLRRKWGTPTDQSLLFMTVIAYYALLRSGQIAADTSWDQFEEGAIDVGLAVGEEQEVGPTRPGHDTD